MQKKVLMYALIAATLFPFSLQATSLLELCNNEWLDDDTEEFTLTSALESPTMYVGLGVKCAVRGQPLPFPTFELKIAKIIGMRTITGVNGSHWTIETKNSPTETNVRTLGNPSSLKVFGLVEGKLSGRFIRYVEKSEAFVHPGATTEDGKYIFVPQGDIMDTSETTAVLEALSDKVEANPDEYYFVKTQLQEYFFVAETQNGTVYVQRVLLALSPSLGSPIFERNSFHGTLGSLQSLRGRRKNQIFAAQNSITPSSTWAEVAVAQAHPAEQSYSELWNDFAFIKISSREMKDLLASSVAEASVIEREATETMSFVVADPYANTVMFPQYFSYKRYVTNAPRTWANPIRRLEDVARANLVTKKSEAILEGSAAMSRAQELIDEAQKAFSQQ
ncbi:MAG: hypothetical protein COT74_01145 [Bdellovibrionales bacterium CG10_big_fil_rev_8_21_14_0_10_45_34]|nr:MAG: hypothetical protein COT74_01145 [Bdellovibrionales bacterium CG10_big_fil_rev_8_21_14_0_10_45_34]